MKSKLPCVLSLISCGIGFFAMKSDPRGSSIGLWLLLVAISFILAVCGIVLAKGTKKVSSPFTFLFMLYLQNSSGRSLKPSFDGEGWYALCGLVLGVAGLIPAAAALFGFLLFV